MRTITYEDILNFIEENKKIQFCLFKNNVEKINNRYASLIKKNKHYLYQEYEKKGDKFIKIGETIKVKNLSHENEQNEGLCIKYCLC